jgi:CDP-glycerol glycerophosphotransferase (TagB/SpsB family)
LILGDGIETTVYLNLCESIADLLGSEAQVVFRPHPLERTSVWAKHPDGMVGKARVDAHQDIYRSFQESGAVVSEVSTGLFEAIGLVPKVFIWDTPKARFSYPLHPFQSFASASELARLVLDESAGRVSAWQMESIWALNWKRNYLDFIEKVVKK